MIERIKFLVNRLREKLWIRPFLMCILSLFGAVLAKSVESTPLARFAPSIAGESVEMLLMTLSGSMLVIATFAVGSMVSSLASAASTSTPRTFTLVVSDDMSQNALSIFIGAFIFSLVSIVFLKNEFYETPGLFALFLLTIITFSVVILTFVRWIDSIARLGRLGTTIDKTVAITARALEQRRRAPTLRGQPSRSNNNTGQEVVSRSIGYIQRVDMASLQKCAEQAQVRIAVRSLPGTFATENYAMATIFSDGGDSNLADCEAIEAAFIIGDRRTFDEDPRFGLIVLSEIAGRALSPAVNDPGTAIDIIGALVRIFTAWAKPLEDGERQDCIYDRVEVPELTVQDMFDDAFTAIARDGAGSVEVAIRLQKALCSLASLGDSATQDAAMEHSQMALARATSALSLPKDLEKIRALAEFSSQA